MSKINNKSLSIDLQASFITHVCLMGEDPTANLTPVIDQSIPSHRILIAHEGHHNDAVAALSKIAKVRGYQVDTWLLPTTLSTESIKLSFMELFEQEIQYQKNSKNGRNREIWLNASNGSRYQVLSAYEVARSYQYPIFVVEPKSDALCWLYPEERSAIIVNDKIKLHEFLLVNGCQMVSQKNQQGISTELRELGENWLNKADKLHSGLAKLNYLAMIAKGQQYTVQQDRAMIDDQSLQWLLEELESCQLIKIDGKSIHFLTDDTRFFCNGGWLEEATFGFVRGLRSELESIQDDGHSVEVERRIKGKTVKNELDVVALVNNKLHVIECKTKRFEHGSGNNTLYKLDSLADTLGGIKGKAALVTFFPINKAEMRRAVELNIRVFSAGDLPHLKERLKRWLSE